MSTGKILVIVGAVLLVVSLFLPLISVAGFGISFVESLQSMFSSQLISTLVWLAAVVVAVVAMVLSLLNKSYKQLALLAGVLGIVAVVLNIVTSGDIGAMISILGIGFWLYAVGSVVELVGGVLKS
jgi:hypothetical protein